MASAKKHRVVVRKPLRDKSLQDKHRAMRSCGRGHGRKGKS